MTMKPVASFVTLTLGALLVVAPGVSRFPGSMSYEQAFAQKGGNTGGNANSHGQSASASSKSTASTENTSTTANSNGKTASSLGALNAANASAEAFVHAAPNSRVGKIKAYYLANEISVAAQTAADATDATALKTAFESTASATVTSAYEDLQADPTNVAYQDAYAQAVADANLTTEQEAALKTAYTDWQNAVAADELAATVEATTQTALNDAANKSPVDAATKAALDALLVGKIN